MDAGHAVKRRHSFVAESLSQPLWSSMSSVDVSTDSFNQLDRYMLLPDGHGNPQPDRDDDQHNRRHADPQRPRQPDRESAGIWSDGMGGGHALSLSPALVGL